MREFIFLKYGISIRERPEFTPRRRVIAGNRIVFASNEGGFVNFRPSNRVKFMVRGYGVRGSGGGAALKFWMFVGQDI